MTESFKSYTLTTSWCGWWDLNPHEDPHCPLKTARLPFRHIRIYTTYFWIGSRQTYTLRSSAVSFTSLLVFQRGFSASHISSRSQMPVVVETYKIRVKTSNGSLMTCLGQIFNHSSSVIFFISVDLYGKLTALHHFLTALSDTLN